MSFVFDPAPVMSLAVSGIEDRFPIRRIYCAGRNYADHLKEFGRDPDPAVNPPIFFMKPADSIISDDADFVYPSLTEDLHFEGELVVALGKGGENLSEEEVMDCVYGYAVGNDLTRRDLQRVAVKTGMPWEWAKSFDHSAACGPIYRVEDVGHVLTGRMKVTVNGEVKQDADVSTMTWSVPKLLSVMSHAMRLEPGDLLYTGTPAGVGAIVPGDVCAVSIEKLGEISTRILPRD